ncbi:restriction endonuclease subunit S (plasmid) [Lactiplantibacillus plantarum]|uniref:restriction endonuclease subunit S n=1 Tax=Lactiplantibacillus plantarum TaxID=1590 RepID=UPI0007BB4D40|nr:restriction endonuclease subunit S [Lactiplantibacillus plantarum]AYE60498.1 restriction endonuclease subunit S [Lactiplantibacillus plantarum]KZU57231.1 Type I restriction-modification system specificity subunit S [Lactiplantibacillus plantarum]QBJ57382.1 restriction endonuclease subunit S [Lactiplantibacillus plantarum]
MKDNQAKYPQLRFKGFTDPWVQRNLADLSDGFSYGLNAAAKEYDGVHGYLRITDIDEVSHSFLPEGLTSPDVPEDQLTDYRMDEQSIVYARTGASTGKTYIYRDSDGELYYAGFLIRQKVNKETSAQFVYQNTLTKAWERYVQVMSQRSGQPGINAQEVGRFELAIPEKAEQDKIAHLFNSLDNLIAANQRKLTKLKELKQGYLQKLFPKNGSKFPQLRFAGFADAWEQRKLGEVGKTQSGIGFPDAEQGGTEGVPFYKVSDMNKPGNEHEMVNANNYVNYEQLSRKKWKIIETVPAVMFAKVGAAIMLNRKRLVTSPFLIDNNTMAYVFDGSWNIDFGKTLFETINLPRYAQVGALPSYNGSDIESIEVTLPNKGEQVKLGAFFKSLDDTITLHQRKLEKLQELKKGYLQKMFC